MSFCTLQTLRGCQSPNHRFEFRLQQQEQAVSIPEKSSSFALCYFFHNSRC